MVTPVKPNWKFWQFASVLCEQRGVKYHWCHSSCEILMTKIPPRKQYWQKLTKNRRNPSCGAALNRKQASVPKEHKNAGQLSAHVQDTRRLGGLPHRRGNTYFYWFLFRN